jgi:hypothetical protein
MSTEMKKPTPLIRRAPASDNQQGSKGNVTRKDANVMTLSQLAYEDIAPLEWLARPWIAPGRPTLIYGAKDVCKSLVAMDLLLAVSYGRPWLGSIKIQRRGRVVYLDFEPKVPPQIRFRQLLDFDPKSEIEPVGERDVEIHCPPEYKLNHPSVQTWLKVICQDTALLIVDSLAACAPGADENDASHRAFLDMLTEVSVGTGASIVVIHHSGHGKGNGKGHGSERPRGSSSISQSCGSEIWLTKDGNFITMTCKSPGAAGTQPEPVTVELTTEGGTNPVTGLVEKIRLRPPRPKPCGKVVPFPTSKTTAAPAKPVPTTDAELVAFATAKLGAKAASVGRHALVDALGIGTTRAAKIQKLLRGETP